ncbi:D-threo-aldose 1-dehydrogenase [Microbacterium halimionae]|uniref:D-threo-aldose 1-dehydrogenase n=1 Tax=Microbacterium halimionae TaxID=1526413 RepID=A0A7W3PKJ0_9MICO|nr:aldo/keto reductase [Microbacterium halimionae]MBA8815173.1 D-threo-aldose 1-dehydrogenase [Microbacterium halimionae]NII94036.1 D-threo-aldose 1-dehydrogenase [Microbacterium halimionae]
MKIAPSPVTLGTSGLGRGTEPGSPEEQAAVDSAVALFESAHTYVDTSNNYSEGRSEAVLGLALQRVGADAEPHVVTKVDEDPETRAFDRDRVLRSFEESCARLGVDTLPLLHFHDPYAVTVSEAMAPGGAVEGLIELRDAGVVGAIGIATYPIDEMTEYIGTGVFDAVLSHNCFTLVDRSATPLFEDARARGMTVFNAAPFGSGILAKGSAAASTYAYREPSAELLGRVVKMEEVCAAHGVPLAAVALHFSLRSPLVDSTVVGIKTERRLHELNELMAIEIPDEIWVSIEEIQATAI